MMRRVVSGVPARVLARAKSRVTVTSVRNPAAMRLVHTSAAVEKVIPYLLTDIGEGNAEAEILEWYVAEGDEVSMFDPICNVQSDKVGEVAACMAEPVILTPVAAHRLQLTSPADTMEKSPRSTMQLVKWQRQRPRWWTLTWMMMS